MKWNTLSEIHYILQTVLLAVAAFIWYNNLFFMSINRKTVFESYVILIVMIAITVVINVFFTIRWRRNIASEITAVLIPFGLYSYITYGTYMPKIYKVIVLVVTGLCVIAVVFIFVAVVRARAKRRRKCMKAKLTYLSVRFIGAVASVSFMICIFCRIYIRGGLLLPEQNAVSTYGGEYTIAGNMDTILLLQEEEWKELSLDERMDVLQCICNIESNYLGLTREIHIYTSKLDDHVMGYYNDFTSSIQISIDLLESGDPSEILDTVCHEMFHAAQHRYVEIYEGLDDESKKSYFLYNASVYADEFKNYKSGRESEDISAIVEYYGQRCEYDARSYAKESVEDYYQRIGEYLKQNEESKNILNDSTFYGESG